MANSSFLHTLNSAHASSWDENLPFDDWLNEMDVNLEGAAPPAPGAQAPIPNIGDQLPIDEWLAEAGIVAPADTPSAVPNEPVAEKPNNNNTGSNGASITVTDQQPFIITLDDYSDDELEEGEIKENGDSQNVISATPNLHDNKKMIPQDINNTHHVNSVIEAMEQSIMAAMDGNSIVEAIEQSIMAALDDDDDDLFGDKHLTMLDSSDFGHADEMMPSAIHNNNNYPGHSSEELMQQPTMTVMDDGHGGVGYNHEMMPKAISNNHHDVHAFINGMAQPVYNHNHHGDSTMEFDQQPIATVTDDDDDLFGDKYLTITEPIGLGYANEMLPQADQNNNHHHGDALMEDDSLLMELAHHPTEAPMDEDEDLFGDKYQSMSEPIDLGYANEMMSLADQNHHDDEAVMAEIVYNSVAFVLDDNDDFYGHGHSLMPQALGHGDTDMMASSIYNLGADGDDLMPPATPKLHYHHHVNHDEIMSDAPSSEDDSIMDYELSPASSPHTIYDDDNMANDSDDFISITSCPPTPDPFTYREPTPDHNAVD
ncbi:hypothetical protein VTJ49DRAFT_5764 [Mycothermus thermophilus]|uniref:Uncharacterized protein n=1 Tax=Humicola insolens TaxID=85995 RepID=A0ABR3V2Y3_HUMIN